MTNDSTTHIRPRQSPSTLATWLLFLTIYLAVYFGSLFSPPLMDDVDSSHAQAAQHIAETGNWITCKINGIRYIEKPPLPYWLVAVSYRVFGQNTFATHLPNALGMLGLTWLAWVWARRAWGARAGLYAGLGVLTSIGPFYLRDSLFQRRFSACFCSSRFTGWLRAWSGAGRRAFI